MVISGTPKEIADLVLEIQSRQVPDVRLTSPLAVIDTAISDSLGAAIHDTDEA